MWSPYLGPKLHTDTIKARVNRAGRKTTRVNDEYGR